MVLLSPDDGALVLALLGPVNATVGNATLSVTTDYPFGDVLQIALAAPQPTPLRVRIPSWASSATMAISGGQPFSVGAFAGSLYTVPLSAAHWAAAAAQGQQQPILIAFDTAPSIRIEHYYAEAASVHRGALAYALQLGENVTVTREYGWGAKDLEVVQPAPPAQGSPVWSSALVLPGGAGAAAGLNFTRLGPPPDVPFSSTQPSCVIRGWVRQVAAWGFAADGSALPPPQSPVDCSAAGACGEPVLGTFVPFGTTHLRMTELPWTLS
jgi:hypothetical protein